MKTLTIVLISSLALLAGCKASGTKTAAPASEGRVLSAAEVTKLFSGKTVEYYHERKYFDVVAYYAPDGSLRGRRGPKLVDAEWSVNGNGELCIHKARGDFCRIIVDENGVYRKYKIKGNGDRVLVVTYHKFIDGNPKGF